MDEAEMIAANAANWDSRTPIHLASDFYNLSGQRDNLDLLAPFERSALGNLTGLDAVHLQCHFGLETLELAALGARTVGLDISAAAITAAQEISAGRATFVRADVYDAAEALAGRSFDLVYTGKGSLVWLPDLDRWATTVASLLRPGGRLYLVEFHPLFSSLGVTEYDDPIGAGPRITDDYLSGGPHRNADGYTYTDGPALSDNKVNFQWTHGLGEVITALARASLRIESLTEEGSLPWRRWAEMESTGHGWWRLPSTAPRIPLLYAITAVRG